MVSFSNPLFSLAGQKERLSNVIGTLRASLGSGKVTADIKNPTLKAGVEFVANNPYTTAGIIAAGASSAARSIIGSTISKASPLTKAGLAAGSLYAGSVVISSPTAATSIIKGASEITPEQLVKGGIETGKAIESNTVDGWTAALKQNKGVAIIGGAILGSSLIKAAPQIGSSITNLQLKQEIAKQSEILSDLTKGSKPIDNTLLSYADNVAKYNAPLLAAGKPPEISEISDFSDPAAATVSSPITDTPTPSDTVPKRSRSSRSKKIPSIRISNKNVLMEVKRYAS